jgi:glycosyltransferase involved in cell wall biosynthesis
VPQKDWETFIYAANEVPKMHPETVFLISGEGQLFNETRELSFNLNLDKTVILTGHIKKIYKVYGIIDVLVNTSLWEGKQ